MKKVGKKLAQFKLILYLCNVIIRDITKGKDKTLEYILQPAFF